MDKHQGEDIDNQTDFVFEVLSKHQDPMEQQVTEAVRIKNAIEKETLKKHKGKVINMNTLNRKLEYFAPREHDSFLSRQ